MTSPTNKVHDDLFEAQVMLLFAQSRLAVSAAPAAGLLLILAMFDAAPWFHHLAWWLLLCAASLWRHVIARRFFALPRPIAQIRSWGRRAIVGGFWSGVVWGSSVLFLAPGNSSHDHMFLAMYLIAVVSVGVASYSALRMAFVAVAVPMLGPATVLGLLHGGRVDLAISLGCLLATVMLFLYMNRMHLSIVESLQLRQENRQLLTLMRATIEATADGIATFDAEGTVINHNQKLQQWLQPLVLPGASARVLVRQVLRRLPRGERWVLLQLLSQVGEQVPLGPIRLTLTAGRVLEMRLEPVKFPGGQPGVVCSCRDITDNQRIETELQDSEKRHRVLIERLSDGVSVTQNGLIKLINPSLERMLGYAQDAVLGQPFIQYVVPEDRTRLQNYHAQRLAGKDVPSEYEAGLVHRDGRVIQARIHNAMVPWSGAPAALATVTDISQRKLIEAELRDSRARLEQLINATPFPLLLSRMADGQVVFANQRACALFEVPAPQALNVRTADLFVVADEHDRLLRDLGQRQMVINRELQLRTTRGRTFWAEITIEPINYGGEPCLYSGVNDITQRRMFVEKMDHLAHHDPLTGLPNRLLFHDRLKHAVLLAERSKERFVLLYADLDGFKPVNDRYGHEVGDQLLVEVAGRLHSAVRASDTLARIGGDEFVLILPSLSDMAMISAIVEKLVGRLLIPFEIAGHTIQIGVSIGIAVYPDDAADDVGLIRHADQAMYRVKLSGKAAVGH